jgi:hypothetical protein
MRRALLEAAWLTACVLLALTAGWLAGFAVLDPASWGAKGPAFQAVTPWGEPLDIDAACR